MSKISTYEVTPVPKLADKLIGTSVGGEIEDITYNFTLSELLNLFIPNIPANTLQGVLDYGNEATQDIILNGTIFTTYLEVTDTATILNSYLTEETHIAGSLYDRLDSAGTAGQVLRSTGTQVEWYSIPNVIPTLQQVLAAGNTADINIILSANIQALTATANNVVSNTSLSVNGTLKDKDASVGTSGQVLSSTGTKVQWIALPVYTATSPLSIDSITRVISIQQASASQNGYLSSADWITFDGKQGSISLTTIGSSGPATLVGSVINVPNYTLSGLGGVPQTRTLTINGVTYNLSADRSWTLATGVSSVSATTPLFSTGGVNPDISIQQSSSSLDGYLSNVDWLTFNSKQPAGNYITSLTGEATAAGPGAAAVTLSNAAVIGKLLTGLNITGGTVVSTDSILTAFGKVQNQINGLVGGVIYKGVWNAATNTPTLVSSVGVQGNYYIVNVAGNTNLNGITDWNVGDWAIFNGSTWNKVDNTDLVTSVNGQVGAVSLTTDNIPEGATNLYFLNSRARAALSFAAGSGAYNSTTGVITIPTDNSQILNGAGYITLASLSASSPLSYNNLTGAFSIQVANTTQNGYLSSTDWNTFNGKQPFLGGTGLVKSVAGVISYITDNSANWNTAYNDSIVSAAVTGTSTKTLTLNQQDAGTVTASWTDLGLTSVGVSMPSAFSVSGSPLTSNGTIVITGAGTTLQYIDGTGALQSFPSLTGYVPYTGATANVNLGIYNLTAASLIKSGGTSSQFLKADGSVDSSAYIVLGSLSATAPLSYNSTTGAFTISQAGTASNGYLSSTDWNTFNDKQPFITAGTTLQYYRGDKTFQTLNTTAVPEGTNLYFTNARAIASTLTGYVSGAGTITSADSLLTAIQKLNGNISGLTTGVSSVFGRTGAVIAVSGDYTTTLVPEGTNLYYLDSRARAAVSLTTVGSSGASTYNSTTGVFNIPDYGAALTGYVPTSRTLNINGTSYDLSADRSWSVGTVTSVAALTLGTTGTDLSSSVATGTTTPVITLNVPTASAANRGALSAADWSTFNTKVGGVTATSPLFSSGGSTPNITIQQSSGSQAGFLSAADWTTFNNKQASGNYITSLTGEATATGPGAASVTLNNASVTGKVLTGVNITGGTVQATDTMLTAFGKLQNQINGLIGSTIYQGTWNASTNTPTLTSGVGVRGYYYIVSVAGTTNLDGITDWFIGDWAIFDGTAWQQVDNTDAVVSVNGFTGAVSLTTDNIPEGTTNQYYLNSRARAALSFVAGSGAYNSTTGVITIPTNNNQITNGANYITLASLSGTAPISYNSGTGAISITQSGTASNGYLSSTDWNTFNNKQAALTNPVTGTGTVNRIPRFSGASTIVNGYITDANDTATVIEKNGSSITAPILLILPATTTNASLIQIDNLGAGSFYIGRQNSGGDSVLMSGLPAYASVIGHTGTQNFNIITSSLVRIMIAGSSGDTTFYSNNVTVTSNYRPYFIANTTTLTEEAGIKIQQTTVSDWYLGVAQGTTDTKDLAVRDVKNSRIIQSWDFAQRSSTFQGYLQVGNAAYDSQWALNVNGKGYIGANPNANGAILYVRDSSPTGANTTFGGLFLGSAPGNDFVIGKKTTNSTGSFEIRTNGITTILALTDSGILRLPTYGAGGITGSPTYRLAVDASGAIIEVTDGGGTVTGTGTANYLSKWSGTSSLTNSIAYDDGSKLILNGTTDPNIGDASTVVKLVINGDQHFSRQSAKIYFGDVTALQPLSIGEGFQADSGLDKDFMSIYHRNKLVILGDPGPGGYYPTRVGIGKTVPGYTLDISNDNITYNRITSFWSGAYMSGWLFSDQNGGITYDAGSNTLNLFANWGTDGTVTIQTKGTTKVAVLGSGNLIVGDGTTDDGADYRIQSRGSILVKGNVNSNYSFYNGVYASSTSTIYGQFVANWESPGNWGIGSKGASDSTVYIGNANSGVISAGTFRLSVLGGVSATGVSFFNSRVNIGGAIDDIDIGLNVSAPSGSGKYIMFGRNSSNVAVFSLSDTGAGSFLGNVTINKTTPGLILNGLGSGNSGAYINFQGWAVTNLNWQIGVANIGPAGLLFTPSTAAGGTTFSSPVISFSDAGRISSVGLSSTASITSTGPLSFSGTSAYIYQYGRLGEPNTGCIIYNNGTGANMFFGEVATSIYGFGNGGTGTAIAGTSVLSFNMGGNVGINIDSPAYSLDVRNASTASTIIANFQAAYDALNEYGVIRIGQGSYNAYFGQMLQTYDVAFMGMTTPAAGNGIYYSTANKAGINTIQPLSVLHTTGIGYTTANLAEVYNSPNSIRVTPRSDSAISLFVGLHIGTNVVGISAASSATESKNISLQTFGGAVAIGKIDPTATLDLAGNFIVSYSPTFSTNGNISEQSTLTMSIPASSSFTSGGTWAASTYTSILTWQGSSSINAGAVTAGFISVNRHSFSTSSTITLSQSGSGIRAVAGLQVLQQTGGTVNGTISHGASLFVQGIYPSNTANVTFTNYYGLLINNLTEWGGVTLGTRYGIYQAGTSDTNYFAAQIIAQGSNGALSVGGSGYTLNPTNMLIGKYTTGRGYIQVPDNGQVEIWDGPTTAFITFKSASTKSLNPIYSTYTKSMATPNGGTQTVRIIEDALGQWILVGRFAANAMSEIQGTWSTVRGLSTSTSQSTATAFSADFGDAYPTEVRVMGATDFDNWRDTRTIDFVYRVPAGRQWQTFFNGGNTDGTFVTSVVPRYGWDCAGTYDGFGRWNNPLNTQIGMADGAYTNPSSAYTTPSSGAIYWNGTGDAKMSVIHTGVYSGQDTYTTSAFGADDAVTGFFDVYPTTSSNMAAGNVYSSAVWILIKLN